VQYNIPVTLNNDIEVITMELNKFEYDMLGAMYDFFNVVGKMPVIKVNPAVMQNKALAIDSRQRNLYESLQKLEACQAVMYTDRAKTELQLWDHDMVAVLRAEFEAKSNG